MPWSRLTDLVLPWVGAFRSQLPWLLLAAGAVLQYASIGMLIDRKHSGEARAAVTHEAAELPSDETTAPVISGLPALVMPLLGARVPDNPELLPGARRAYRGGVHQGVDFDCPAGTPVRAAAAGFVFLIDDEPNLPEPLRDEALTYCQRTRQTPDDVLQALHGRHVVLWHGVTERGLLTTWYSHLDRISPELEPGMRVDQSELIGWAGASGTSHQYRSPGWGELHFEVRLDGKPLGIGLTPAEAGALYCQILSEQERP